MKELDLQKQIIQWLNYQGHFVWKTNVGVFFKKYKDKTYAFRVGMKGMSDIIGIMRDGRLIAIECKIKYGKPTKEQKQFLEEVRNRGGVAFVARSLDDAIEFTKQI